MHVLVLTIERSYYVYGTNAILASFNSINHFLVQLFTLSTARCNFPVASSKVSSTAMIAVSSANLPHYLLQVAGGRSCIVGTGAGDLYLTTHNTHNRHMPPAEFEPTISASERPQTYASDRKATGTGVMNFTISK